MGRKGLAYDAEVLLAAVEKGVTRTGTARVLGCSYMTIVRYAKRYKSVEEALDIKRRELVDLAEMGLRGAVLREEPWAIAFALKTLGKDQGYTERSEHLHQEADSTVTFRVVFAEDLLGLEAGNEGSAE